LVKKIKFLVRNYFARAKRLRGTKAKPKWTK